MPDKPVLRKLDLRIDRDDRIGLLGENGNGKSTFAKLLGGKLQPLAGFRAFEKIDRRLLRAAPDGRTAPQGRPTTTWSS